LEAANKHNIWQGEDNNHKDDQSGDFPIPTKTDDDYSTPIPWQQPSSEMERLLNILKEFESDQIDSLFLDKVAEQILEEYFPQLEGQARELALSFIKSGPDDFEGNIISEERFSELLLSSYVSSDVLEQLNIFNDAFEKIKKIDIEGNEFIDEYIDGNIRVNIMEEAIKDFYDSQIIYN